MKSFINTLKRKGGNSCAALVTVLMLIMFITGCGFWGGAAVGAAGAGAAYEYSAKQQLDRLEKDYKAGNITKEEYESRKRQIEEGSIIY
jgi:hypothetical protein